jgi:hypothetical protein
VRRIQIHLDQATDDALAAEAARTGTLQAALIRLAVSARFGRLVSADEDPIDRLVGSVDVEPIGVDDVVYG